MEAAKTYQWLADWVLVVHVGVVLFVVGGLFLVIAGNARGWLWVNRWWFRVTHALTIAVVIGQSWLGQHCPLTLLESWLRVKAGQSAYASSFIQHWLHALLYWQAPLWLFAIAYTAFGGLVAWAWWRYPLQR